MAEDATSKIPIKDYLMESIEKFREELTLFTEHSEVKLQIMESSLFEELDKLKKDLTLERCLENRGVFIQMTKLKTLKDIDFEYDDWIAMDRYKERLRQEAIKWIKKFKVNNTQDRSPVDIDDIVFSPDFFETEIEFQFACDFISRWIKHFFNIKDSDIE